MYKLRLGLWLVSLVHVTACGSTVDEVDTDNKSGGDSTDNGGGGDGGDEGASTDEGTDIEDADGDGLPDSILIQAECAVSGFSGDCNGDFTGGTSESEPVWGQASSYPNLDPAADTVVGFFNGGTWIRIDGVNLTLMNTVKMHLANGAGADGQFELRLGSPDGMRIATVSSPVTAETDDWTVFQTVTQVLQGSFSGSNDVYVLAVNPDVGNGNLDWFEFSADPNVQIDTDTGAASSRIQAECALGPAVGDCNATYTGDTSHSPALWGGADEYPAVDPANPGTVGYFTHESWIRLDGIDLTGMTSVTASISGMNDGTGFYVYLDNPTGTPIAAIPVGNTGGWSVFAEVQDTLSGAYTGIHSVFFVGDSPDPENTGVGNLDWFEFQ